MEPLMATATFGSVHPSIQLPCGARLRSFVRSLFGSHAGSLPPSLPPSLIGGGQRQRCQHKEGVFRVCPCPRPRQSTPSFVSFLHCCACRRRRRRRRLRARRIGFTNGETSRSSYARAFSAVPTTAAALSSWTDSINGSGRTAVGTMLYPQCGGHPNLSVPILPQTSKLSSPFNEASPLAISPHCCPRMQACKS